MSVQTKGIDVSVKPGEEPNSLPMGKTIALILFGIVAGLCIGLGIGGFMGNSSSSNNNNNQASPTTETTTDTTGCTPVYYSQTVMTWPAVQTSGCGACVRLPPRAPPSARPRQCL